uniref:WS/DGAT domain-containing protein n=1 Tax=Mycobacterium sp. TaxID=1785 RepID=UPI003D0C5AFB
SPGGMRELTNVALRFTNEIMPDPEKPPWRFCIVEGLMTVPGAAPGSLALITKYHHALVDGVLAFQLLNALHDSDQRPQEAVPVIAGSDKIPGQASLLMSAAAHTATRGVTAMRVGSRVFRKIAAAQFRRGLKRPGSVTRPTTPFSGPVSAARVFSTWRCTLFEAKSLKRHVPEATVNDVMMTLIGGALRRYLAGTDELPHETLAALCPISFRAEGAKEVAGNHATMMLAPIGTDIDDPALRLAIIADATKSAKATVSDLGPQTFAEVATLLPGAIGSPLLRVMHVLAGKVPLPFSGLAISNVPGPREPLSAAGVRVADIFAMSFLIDGMGLVVGIMNYLDDLILTVTADGTAMPDVDIFIECIDQSWKELSALPE